MYGKRETAYVDAPVELNMRMNSQQNTLPKAVNLMLR
jgi:hypothetical protein